MQDVNRRSAVALGLAAASAAMVKPASAQTTGYKDATPWPGAHITEGELLVEQEGKTFTAKKNFVWTCNKDTKEQVSNPGSVVAIMRITDLKA